ncbi:MAG: site-2 protease family protein [Vulcanimicrobiaceae bacterium]
MVNPEQPNPPHQDPEPPVAGEYLPPNAAPGEPPQGRRNTAKGAGAAATGLGLLVLKFKTLLAFLLQFKFFFFGLKLLSLTWPFLLTLWLYVVFFGWKLAVVIILLVLAHEMGHYAAFRAYGLPVKMPVFLPFMAYTAGAVPADLEQDAYIALAGPLTGLALAATCYGVGLTLHDNFWFACADLSAFLNLFNMIPVPPFDGGRVIGAVWPALWVFGFALFIGLSIVLHIPILFVLLIGLIGLPSMISAWRGHVDPRAASMTNAARLRVSVWYLMTLLGLILVMGQAHGLTAGMRGAL